MVKIATNLILRADSVIGEELVVEAEWPDGTIEQIDTFKTRFEALNWVNNRSKAWLQERND